MGNNTRNKNSSIISGREQRTFSNICQVEAREKKNQKKRKKMKLLSQKKRKKRRKRRKKKKRKKRKRMIRRKRIRQKMRKRRMKAHQELLQLPQLLHQESQHHLLKFQLNQNHQWHQRGQHL